MSTTVRDLYNTKVCDVSDSCDVSYRVWRQRQLWRQLHCVTSASVWRQWVCTTSWMTLLTCDASCDRACRRRDGVTSGVHSRPNRPGVGTAGWWRVWDREHRGPTSQSIADTLLKQRGLYISQESLWTTLYYYECIRRIRYIISSMSPEHRLLVYHVLAKPAALQSILYCEPPCGQNNKTTLKLLHFTAVLLYSLAYLYKCTAGTAELSLW